MFLKRIIAFLLIISILFSFAVYAFAAPVVVEEGLKWAIAFIGDYIVGKALDSAADGSLEKKLYDFIHPFEVGDCTVSSDRDHHWVQSFYNDEFGTPHVEYICSACNAYLCRAGEYESGNGFSGRGGVFGGAYDSYVEDLPYSGVSDIGGFYLPVSHDYSYVSFYFSGTYYYSYCSHDTSHNSQISVSFSCSDSIVSVSYFGSSRASWCSFDSRFRYHVPFPGRVYFSHGISTASFFDENGNILGSNQSKSSFSGISDYTSSQDVTTTYYISNTYASDVGVTSSFSGGIYGINANIPSPQVFLFPLILPISKMLNPMIRNLLLRPASPITS